MLRELKKWLRAHEGLRRVLFLLCIVIVADLCFAACSKESSMELTSSGAAVSEETALAVESASAENSSEKGVSAGKSAEKETSAAELSAGEASAKELPAEENQIYVDVAGAVCAPGVITLPEGSRVYEAIARAGGMKEEAAPAALNQAALLEDGQQIYVPTREEAEQGFVPGTAAGAAASSGTSSLQKVNINTADEKELQTLPGIGPQKAGAIVAYRQAQGSFASIEDIMKVSGIKQAGFDKIKDSITVH